MTRCRSVSIRSVTSNCTSVGRKTCDTVTPDTAFNLELLSGSLQCKCHRSQDVLRQQLVIKGHEKNGSDMFWWRFFRIETKMFLWVNVSPLCFFAIWYRRCSMSIPETSRSWVMMGPITSWYRDIQWPQSVSRDPQWHVQTHSNGTPIISSPLPGSGDKNR